MERLERVALIGFIIFNIYIPLDMAMNPTDTYFLTPIQLFTYWVLTFIGVCTAYIYGKYFFGNPELQP